MEKVKATDNLETIAEEIRSCFSSKEIAREKALRLCRELIRISSNAIRAAHRQEKENAKELLDSGHKLISELNNILEGHNDLFYSGFVHDAQKEFAEASITLALINGEAVPEPGALRVGYAAYLNGLGEAVGELRRYLLDSLRRDDFSRCEELLVNMDDIYAVLVTMDFPDAMTYGLRRTTEVVRGILEKTRGELTLVLKQKELEQKLPRG